MESLIIVIHILSAVAIIGLVLIQHGKGADMGASFGSGASQTIFGSAGSGNVLTRSTTWLAVVFFLTSLGLAVVARDRADAGVELEALLANPDAAAAVIPAAPATDVPVLDVQATVESPVADMPAVEAAAIDTVPEAADTATEVVAPAAETTVEPAAQTTENQ
jgi:preprotein translocase subunit SecG